MAEENKTSQNELILIYKTDKNDISIFGSEFVSRCIENCHLMIEGEKVDLQSKYTCPKDKEQIEIKLIETEKIDDMSSMFDGCKTLISIK